MELIVGLIVGFIVIVVVVLWALIPIALIVIAIKMSGMYRIALNSLRLSESIVQKSQEELEKEFHWNWDAVNDINKRAETKGD